MVWYVRYKKSTICIVGHGMVCNKFYGMIRFLPASPMAKAGLGVGSLRPSVRQSVCPSVRPEILSSQLLWNYWSNYHETWYVDRTSYVVMHIGRKFWSPYFCGSNTPWNLENTHKSPCHRNSSETTDPIIMKPWI